MFECTSLASIIRLVLTDIIDSRESVVGDDCISLISEQLLEFLWVIKSSEAMFSRVLKFHDL